MNYVNRSLELLCHEIPCTARIPGVCIGGNGQCSHSNQSRHGKGKSMKAHSCFIAAICQACHVEIDSGKNLTREQREDIWNLAHARTLLYLFQTGLVVVAGEKAVVHKSYQPIPKIFPRPSKI